MNEYGQTQDRIISAALDLFLEFGIKKTSLEDVAARCGLTRATVYRYYRDKRELVRASFMHMVDIVGNALNDLDKHSQYTTRKSAEYIRQAVASLPKGDLPSRLNELKILYPDIFEEYQHGRLGIIKRVYGKLTSLARSEDLLAEDGIDYEVFQTVIAESIIFITQHPLVLSKGTAFKDIYNFILDLWVYGILGIKERNRKAKKAKKRS
jgi:AcrR family transcriptional regulator